MAATATATKKARTTTRRPASPQRRRPSGARPRRGVTPASGFMIPAAAVGRTAVAVSDFADSGLMVRLTRSRLWIGLVGAMLVGIVALNVLALSFSASGSQIARQAEGVARENSALRAELTNRLSNERIQGTAGKLGLSAPEPGSIRYIEASDRDAAVAAKRLRDGSLSTAAVTGVEPVASAVTEPAVPEAAVPATTEPAPTEAPAPAAPTAPAP